MTHASETFGSTSSMLAHGLQQLLHALTHDTMSCDSPSVKTTTAEYHCPLWYSTSSFFLTCPHFPRTARRHRSSIQIRVHVSRVLDHRSERLTKKAAITMFRRSAPLGPIQLDVVECRWHSETFPRQQLPGPYSGSQFGIIIVSIESSTLSTTGCCRSRSFSSDNHRNSFNKISTCCLNRYFTLQRESFHLSW